MEIILASASFRRRELLHSLGLKFIVIPSAFDETNITFKDPKKLVEKLSLEKALIVKKNITYKKFLVISADTIVAIKNEKKYLIMGKPKTRTEAEKMLNILKNKQHLVLTGIILIDSNNKITSLVETTKVYIGNITDKKMKAYLDQGFYLDRAGAYGIQDSKFTFIKKYIGSYSNILGLPLEPLVKALKEYGIASKIIKN